MPENKIEKISSTFENDELVGFLDWLIVLSRYKKLIAGVTFASVLAAAGISLKMPNVYTSTIQILPPQQSQPSASALLNQLGGGVGIAGGKFGVKNPGDIYMAILKSRNVLERVVNRFDLQKIYGTKSMAVTVLHLRGMVTATSDKDGIISVGVSDNDPKLAAEMANAIIEELDKTMQTFALSDASHRRSYFEQQMKSAKGKVTDAELLLDRTPNTSLQYPEALRNLRYQESIYQMLAKQYDMAKLDEAKDYPLIQVLDKAEIPETKSRPKRLSIVAMASVSAFVFSLFLVFFLEMLGRKKGNPKRWEKLAQLKKNLSIR